MSSPEFLLLSGKIHHLSDQGPLIAEVLDKLRLSCLEALTDKKRSVHLLYESWSESMSDVRGVLGAPRLRQSAWHMISADPPAQRESVAECFVRDFLSLQRQLDTKETNFFFRCSFDRARSPFFFHSFIY